MAHNRQNNRGNYQQNRNQIRNHGDNQTQSQPSSSGNIIQLAVKGWALAPSKFADNPESGVSAIVTFLEKKSQRKIQSYKAIGKTFILLIDIDAADASRFHHLNGFTFSGAPITVEESRGRPNQNQQGPPNTNNRTPLGPGHQNQQANAFSNVPSGPRNPRSRNDDTPFAPRNGADLITGHNRNSPFHNNSQNVFASNNNQNQKPFGRNQQNQHSNQPRDARDPAQTQLVENLMISIIRKRYTPDQYFLTFEALSNDPDIQASALIESSADKVWTAFFTICEKKVFETPAKRREMVQSVSLARNDLNDAKDVIALSATFPQLKNLDLSHNNIKTAFDLRYWRNSLGALEHLILLNNPIMDQPAELQKITRWYRSLKMLNNEPVAPNGMALDAAFTNRTASPAPPIPGITTHPEVDLTTFAQPLPGKPEDQLMKERMGLQFSVETHLKMQYVEMCLSANGFNYDAAINNLRELLAQGQVPADAFLG